MSNKLIASKPSWGKVALGSFSEEGQLDFMHQIYGWMRIGLLLTAGVAYWVASTPTLAGFIIGNRLIFYSLLILELLAVIFLAGMVHKISATLASIVFLLYAALNGLTFSIIFFVYTISSISSVFLITAGIFGGMSLYGYFTKKD